MFKLFLLAISCSFLTDNNKTTEHCCHKKLLKPLSILVAEISVTDKESNSAW